MYVDYQLIELEEQSVELEENLRRTMMAISRFPSGMLQRLRHVMRLQRSLRNLQARLRDAIETLSHRSKGKKRRRIFSIRSMLERKQFENQVKTIVFLFHFFVLDIIHPNIIYIFCL